MSSWLVTGSNRGIGLALVDTLLKDPTRFVVATARDIKSKRLQDLANEYPKDRLALVQLDVTDSESISEAVNYITSLLPNGIDYFISNAGINHQPLTLFEDLDLSLFSEEINFYTVDVIRLIRGFLPLVLKSSQKKILFVSSILGSISLGCEWPELCNAYSISKAALNMLTVKWGTVLKPKGVLMASVHPGWVVTEMGDAVKEYVLAHAPEVPQITPEEASKSLITIAENLTSDSLPHFISYDGHNLPW